MTNIQGLSNIRDLHGTYGDKEIMRNRLFRSDALFQVDAAGYDELRKLHIRHIVDFRSDEELEANHYILPKDFIYHHVSALHCKDGLENFYFFMLLNEHSTKEDVYQVSAFIREGYKILPFHNKAFQEVFNLMLDQEEGILFHCSSGKDRTGVMTALILKMFGVDEETIFQDYLLSNQNIMEQSIRHAEELTQDKEVQKAMLYCTTVHEELLQSTFDEILKKYQDWDHFFEAEYGLDAEKIKGLRNKYMIKIK